MNPDLLSANLSLAFMAVAGAALLLGLGQIAGAARPMRMAAAGAAAGLVYLFGVSAFGWNLLSREALFAAYAAIFALFAAAAILRRARGDDSGAPLGATLIQQAAMAYVFSPPGRWKPALSALLAIYFLLEALTWLKGSEPEAEREDPRPPLFPPKRVRGMREFAGACLAAAFVYVFAMGTGRPPVAPEPVAETSVTEAPLAAPESAEAAPETVEAAPEPVAAASESQEPARKTYTAAGGETLKTVARKLYGKADKWRALASANPGVKPDAKLKAGKVLNLPEPQVK